MKVLIADQFEQVGIDAIAAAGCEVIYRAGARRPATRGRARRPRGPTCSSSGARRSPSRCSTTASLSLIVRAGAGVNTIDVTAASRRGIYVSNCPGKNAIAVAELTFALILALDRRIADNVTDLRAGKWNKKEYSKATGTVRTDARHSWLRQHRPGSRAPRARVRDAGRRLEPTFQRDLRCSRGRDARRSRHHDLESPEAVADRTRRSQRAPRVGERARGSLSARRFSIDSHRGRTS